jgi:hypothetical protein
LEYLQDLSLLGTALAAHEVADLKGEEVGGRGPSGLAGQFGVVEFLGDGQQSVDDPVQIEDDVAVQVVDRLQREFPAGLFYLLDVAEAVPF